MNYNETRDLIRSLTKELTDISEGLDNIRVMFQTDKEGNPTEEAKSQLFYDQRNFIAKKVMPRDLKGLSLKLIDSIPAIKDYIGNWSGKADPDINSLSIALGNIIGKRSSTIERLVPGYDDFLSDCERSRKMVSEGNTNGHQSKQAPKYLTDEFIIRLHDSQAFKEAKDKKLIDDDQVWKGTKRGLVNFLIDNGLVDLTDHGQYQWKELDGVFSWIVDRGVNKGQIRQISKEELRAIQGDLYQNG